MKLKTMLCVAALFVMAGVRATTCNSDSDCVPSTWCHPKTCVASGNEVAQQPDETCTAEWETGDITQADCHCVSGSCDHRGSPTSCWTSDDCVPENMCHPKTCVLPSEFVDDAANCDGEFEADDITQSDCMCTNGVCEARNIGCNTAADCEPESTCHPKECVRIGNMAVVDECDDIMEADDVTVADCLCVDWQCAVDLSHLQSGSGSGSQGNATDGDAAASATAKAGALKSAGSQAGLVLGILAFVIIVVAIVAVGVWYYISSKAKDHAPEDNEPFPEEVDAQVVPAAGEVIQARPVEGDGKPVWEGNE